ncbi:hypothetical protein HPB48_008251 [Haemaphysalis longicornis]|uniref:FERM C-terminal PH-like domain-containing protein n=1 Tax=Haemaphysalis longicornis TaxID=44386 RepID=A0A9J6GZX0_HAELO|nr:hypothetical protein HPB48_008251 [Haemaphysalis longicornis]
MQGLFRPKVVCMRSPGYGGLSFQPQGEGVLSAWRFLTRLIKPQNLSQEASCTSYQRTQGTSIHFILWKLLENLYFRDKKFSIEVHNPRRVVHALSSFNVYEDVIEAPPEGFDPLADAISDSTTQVSVSRRTFGPGNVTVVVWFAATPSLTKSIWSMAIAQHQFYLDNNVGKRKIEDLSSLEKFAAELSKSSQSLSSVSTGSSLSRSASCHSLPAIKIEDQTDHVNEEAERAKQEMLTALKARKEALEEALRRKLEELKSLCLREGEVTGELPPETPLEPGEPPPQVRRRVGTAFILDDQLLSSAKSKEETLSSLELEYELQNKITSAALRLANDMSADRSLRRQRKISYQQAHEKLKQVEQKLGTLKKQRNHGKSKMVQQSDDEPSEDNISQSTGGSDTQSRETINVSDISPAMSPKLSAPPYDGLLAECGLRTQQRVPDEDGVPPPAVPYPPELRFGWLQPRATEVSLQGQMPHMWDQMKPEENQYVIFT